MNNEQIITLRYDGLESDNHVIPLSSLAESIKGIDKILSTAGDFSQTLEFNSNKATQSVTIYAKEARANCFSLDTVITFAQQNQLFSGFGGAVLALIVQYVFAKNSNNKEEMKELSKNLQIAIAELSKRPEYDKQHQLMERMLDSIDRMADSLRPAVRQAYHPIGKDCETLTISSKEMSSTYTQKDKDNLTQPERLITESQQFTVYISELDINSGGCKVSIIGDNLENRISGKISDPILSEPTNPYTKSLHEQSAVTLAAKAEIIDGAIKKLYISDVVK